ncbi:MAG: hypothetical protein K2K81_07420 [Muribaculaceae bacterium]|nr:hypothetical protein [Muribaculaceae bacterium]
MSLGDTDIQGSASVSRHARVGGSARVNGDLTVGHVLFVEGGIESRSVMMANKGMFRTLEKLKGAYPSPEDGWWALVGDELPAELYVSESGRWVNTGKKSGVTMVYREFANGLEDVALLSVEEAQEMLNDIFKKIEV